MSPFVVKGVDLGAEGRFLVFTSVGAGSKRGGRLLALVGGKDRGPAAAFGARCRP